jgi:hypothetical protein
MRLLGRIAAVLGGLLVLYAVVGLLLPKRYHVERSIVIDAPAEAIFPTINTLKEWPTWTAWTKENYPGMKVLFAGPEAGVGAKYSWTGEKVGTGELQITEADPAQGIKYDLDFENGKQVSLGGLRLEPADRGTKVTWWTEGDLGWRPVHRYFGLLMDSMMGPDFETGLNNLKKKIESTKSASAGDTPAPADSTSNGSKKTG